MSIRLKVGIVMLAVSLTMVGCSKKNGLPALVTGSSTCCGGSGGQLVVGNSSPNPMTSSSPSSNNSGNRTVPAQAPTPEPFKQQITTVSGAAKVEVVNNRLQLSVNTNMFVKTLPRQLQNGDTFALAQEGMSQEAWFGDPWNSALIRGTYQNGVVVFNDGPTLAKGVGFNMFVWIDGQQFWVNVPAVANGSGIGQKTFDKFILL